MFPDSMIGFRWNLSTQDAFIQMKKAVPDRKIPGENIYLTLDLKGAFDVSHKAYWKP